jgi:hypothetical protein
MSDIGNPEDDGEQRQQIADLAMRIDGIGWGQSICL